MARTSLRWVSHGSPAIVPPTTPPATPTFIQGATATSGVPDVASLDVVLSTPASAGNLIVVAATSDALVTGPSGFSTAATAINAQGCYLFYKIAGGGETTLTCTPSASRPIALVAAEYSGITPSSPVDQTVSNTATTGGTTGPISAGTTGSTSQASELVLAVGGLHGFAAVSPPIAPVWGGGYTDRGSTDTDSVTNGTNCATFLAELVVSSVGTQTTTLSWTNSISDWGAIIATFKSA